ncbi:flagellar basal body P-ring formation protein FlgA [Yersinia enterocolitica]|uniref:flagellar basal body P-ring formation chaperone FlgA n=1 Tax=Yersinia enterocolitica TaxID=630 RepID=UPI0006819403|nr:flagellar basal body P-ring formation chaperone FlgA [Yersinia enterocolitica]EKN3941370.1 flagellar basal body P-ring formation protein FlgA [Yersinia enterocolitica]EKN3981737.1 flagellar basal body P-ring formation protein FlgA [Yersinia enterocolitica]EKN3986830.1 flagellar basal body P-ring formation protein FlgA [Yersinia enterocolitica]EKN4713470.1 flagellar basal body P-ring formation protein FlgA [Yersinia enterocolitica]EKN4754671.1 flagellar basal body P-ring formation protein Fl
MQTTCQVYNIMIRNRFSLFPSPNGKHNFPSLRPLLIRFSCRWLPLSVGLISLYAGTANSAEIHARKQVYAQALHAASADISQTAKNKNWQGYTVKMNIFIPSEVSRYKVCNGGVRVAAPANGQRDISRLRYDISCPDTQGWEVSVTVKPDIYLPVWVAKNTLERGKVVAPDDIELKKKNISTAQGGYITDPDEIIGLTVKRRIRGLQVVIPSQLEQPVLVARGQQVLMIAEQDGIEARMLGEALKNGRKGELIKVRNLSSKRTVTAIVDDMAKVRMLGITSS